MASAPEKRVRTAADMSTWQQSASHQEIVDFLSSCANSVLGKPLPAEVAPGDLCPCVRSLLAVLKELSDWVSDIPLQALTDQRFGNRAFRDWHGRLLAQGEGHMARILEAGGADTAHAKELAVYWADAFGNATRIDYGTGHELNFALVLLLLTKLKCIPPEHQTSVVTVVFARYIMLMRTLQSVYKMEPAGSHGVWGLDDYHHLPFYWGAAQLVGNRRGMEPVHLPRDAPSARFDYLYHDAIAWVLENKRGPFHEHSPTLQNLCALTWPRIQTGMLKMYCGEVLGKWPVVQHVHFGRLFPWPDGA